MESLNLSIRIERRWPLLALAGVALAWFVVAAITVLARTPPAPSLAEVAAVLLALLPPVALGLIVAALLPKTGQSLALAEAETRLEGARGLVTELLARIESVDARLASSVDRTRALSDAASAALPGLGGSAEALETAVGRLNSSSATTRQLVDAFAEALPALARTIGEVDTTLRAVGSDSAVQLRAVEATLASVQDRSRAAAAEADASIAEMTSLLGRIDEASTRNTAALSKRAYALDAAVDGVLERATAAVDHMREQVEAQLRGLEGGVDFAGRSLTLLGDDSARLFNQRLEMLLATSTSLQGHFADHEAATARLQTIVSGHVEDLRSRIADLGVTETATIDDLGARIGTVQAQADGLAAPLATSREAIAALEAQSDAFGNRFADVDDVLNERLASARQAMTAVAAEAEQLFATVTALRTTADDSGVAFEGLVERTTAAIDRMRAEVEAQLAVLETGVTTATRQVADDADGRAAAFDQRIAALLATSATLQQHFGDHEGASARLQAVVASHVEDLRARLAQLGEAGAATTDALGQRLASLRASADGLGEPLAASGEAVAGLAREANAFEVKIAELEAVLDARLGDTRRSMAEMGGEAGRLFENVAALGASVADGSTLIGDAASVLASERNEVVRLAEQLAGHFDAARAALADIEQGSAAAAAGIDAGLGAEVARIAAAGDAAAAEIRSALAAVVDEAIASLAEAAGTRAETAFGAPVRAEIAAIESATARAAAVGQDAAGRLAGQMLRLVGTVDTVEARIGEVETQFAIRARDSLTARSARLINQLNTAAVDVANLLAITIGDAEWGAYLKGDRSVFARAIAARLDRDSARQISRLYQQDPEFRADATRYCETFEALITRLVGDQDGEALATMMLSTDLGKIYVGIAAATDRLPPSR